MEIAEYDPKLVPYIVETGALRDDPFVLIDIGCGMGIDPVWRVLEPDLIAHGLDPQEDEVERLAGAETNPKVHYHATLVGLPDSDPYHQRRREAPFQTKYFDPMQRSSAFAAIARETQRGRESLSELNTWNEHPLTPDKIALSEFIGREGLTSVDFVKTDTDGNDYEVLLSVGRAIDDAEILGFQVETPFNAAPNDYVHALPNVDQFLRERGLLLFTMTVNRYSRSALPARFEWQVMAQTQSGQVIWGDVVYMRDGGSPDYGDVWKRELSPTKLLKLACLYELYRLPDCAAELLLRHESELRDVIDVRRALELVTPALDGRELTYEEYTALFERDPYAFYPQESVLGTAKAAAGNFGGRFRQAFAKVYSRL